MREPSQGESSSDCMYKWHCMNNCKFMHAPSCIQDERLLQYCIQNGKGIDSVVIYKNCVKVEQT